MQSRAERDIYEKEWTVRKNNGRRTCASHGCRRSVYGCCLHIGLNQNRKNEPQCLRKTEDVRFIFLCLYKVKDCSKKSKYTFSILPFSRVERCWKRGCGVLINVENFFCTEKRCGKLAQNLYTIPLFCGF